MRALIVDDSRAVRLMLKRMLSEAGFTDCAEAGHGIEALERLDESRDLPDVMLAAGASEYVMKPFTREVILEKLDLLGIRANAVQTGAEQ